MLWLPSEGPDGFRQRVFEVGSKFASVSRHRTSPTPMRKRQMARFGVQHSELFLEQEAGDYYWGKP